MLKIDKENAMDRCEQAEIDRKVGEEKVVKLEEELQGLQKREKATQEELGNSKEKLTTANENLEIAEKKARDVEDFKRIFALVLNR